MRMSRRFATLTLATATMAGSSLALLPQADAAVPTATDGWAVVTLGRPGKDGLVRGNTNLSLVSPTGRQYRVGTVPAGYDIADVTRDGRKILFNTQDGRGHWKTYDTRTRTFSTLHGSWREMMFTNPSGKAFIARAENPKSLNTPIVKLDSRGRKVLTFAAVDEGAPFTQTMDGKYVVSTNAKGQPVLLSNATGKVVRALPKPAGATACWPMHHITPTTFTGVCLGKGVRVDTYRFSTTGSRPVALTTGIKNTFGFADSWSTPKGQVLQFAAPAGPSPFTLRKSPTKALVAGSAAALVKGTRVYNVVLPADYTAAAKALTVVDIATGKKTDIAGGTRNKGFALPSVHVITATR